MSAPNIKPLREDRKTHTRRIINPQPKVTEQRLRELGGWVQGMTLREQVNAAWQAGFVDVKCPYGKPGDRLWVREAWRTEVDAYDHLSPSEMSGKERVIYEADSDWSDNHTVGRYRHARFMPRWASRLLLEITEVRVERLQDINGLDAIAEGLIDLGIDGARWHWDATAKQGHFAPWRAYRALWESINGPGSWDENPWVWVIEFKKI
jgi:hypothetical protein